MLRGMLKWVIERSLRFFRQKNLEVVRSLAFGRYIKCCQAKHFVNVKIDEFLTTIFGQAASRDRTRLSWVVVSNMFYFHPYLGKIPILTNIFQMG